VLWAVWSGGRAIDEKKAAGDRVGVGHAGGLQSGTSSQSIRSVGDTRSGGLGSRTEGAATMVMQPHNGAGTPPPKTTHTTTRRSSATAWRCTGLRSGCARRGLPQARSAWTMCGCRTPWTRMATRCPAASTFRRRVGGVVGEGRPHEWTLQSLCECGQKSLPAAPWAVCPHSKPDGDLLASTFIKPACFTHPVSEWRPGRKNIASR